MTMLMDLNPDDACDQWVGSADQPIGWTTVGHNAVVPNPVIRRSLSTQLRWCATIVQLSQWATVPIQHLEVSSSSDKAIVSLQDSVGPIRFLAQTNGQMQMEC